MQKILLVLFLVFYSQVQAQDPIRSRKIVEANYTPTDFFIHYAAACGNIHHTLLLGFGINRTVFQKRFYPEIGYQYIKDFKLLNGVYIAPYGRLTFNRLKVTTAGAHYWINPELGCNLEFGNSKRIGIGAGYRSLFEFWRENKQTERSTDFGLTGNIY